MARFIESNQDLYGNNSNQTFSYSDSSVGIGRLDLPPVQYPLATGSSSLIRNDSVTSTPSTQGNGYSSVTPPVPGPGRVRSAHACQLCRRQKMKCEGPSKAPCKRCRNAKVACIFEQTSEGKGKEESIGFENRTSELERHVASLESRISMLESELLLQRHRPPSYPQPLPPLGLPYGSNLPRYPRSQSDNDTSNYGPPPQSLSPNAYSSLHLPPLPLQLQPQSQSQSQHHQQHLQHYRPEQHRPLQQQQQQQHPSQQPQYNHNSSLHSSQQQQQHQPLSYSQNPSQQQQPQQRSNSYPGPTGSPILDSNQQASSLSHLLSAGGGSSSVDDRWNGRREEDEEGDGNVRPGKIRRISGNGNGIHGGGGVSKQEEEGARGLEELRHTGE